MSPLFSAIDYVSERENSRKKKSRKKEATNKMPRKKKSQKNRMSRIKKVAKPENESVNLHNPNEAPYNTTML